MSIKYVTALAIEARARDRGIRHPSCSIICLTRDRG